MTTRSHGTRRRLVRAVALLLLLPAVLLVTAGPAFAHGRGSDATNFSSEVTDAPQIEGLRWRVYGGDELLALSNDSEEEVLIYGYGTAGHDPEPYLRIGPNGVFENRRSPAAYLNAERYGQVELPPHVDATAAPDWVQVSSGTRHAWHDHRIHYMGTDPTLVVPDLEAETVVYERWEVPFAHGDTEHVLAGQLTWVPGPTAWPWLLAVLPFVLLALVGLRTEPADGRWPGLARPAALLLGVVVALNLTHLLDDLFSVPVPWGVRALAAVQTLLFLAIGAFGAVRGYQAGEGAFTALGVGAGAILVGQGLLYWPVLGASQMASMFPDTLARVTVAVSIMQAVPVGAVAFIGTRRLLPPPATEPAPADPAAEPA